MRPSPAEACPCGQPAPYAACCGRYVEHFQATPAPDAERLMRSRYSAFVRQRAGYLLATWHPSTRPAELSLDAQARWLGLEVRRAAVTGTDTAEVEFVARYRLQGRAVRLHERSRFVREGGRWWYVDGDALSK